MQFQIPCIQNMKKMQNFQINFSPQDTDGLIHVY